MSCLEVLEHAVKDGAIRLSDGPKIESPHLCDELLLIIRGHPLQEVQVICNQYSATT